MANQINKDDLSELNAIFEDMGGIEKVEEYANSYEKLPDGNYLGEIDLIEAKNSNSSGKPMINVRIAVEGGKKEFKPLMLAGDDLKKTQIAIGRTVSQLKKLGADISSNNIAIIIDEAEKLIGTRVNVEIKTTKGFRNINLTLA